MTRLLAFTCACLTLSAAALLAIVSGCGGSSGSGGSTSSSGAAGAAGTGAHAASTSTTASTSASTQSAGTTSASSSTGAPPPPLTCATYCTEVMTNCTGTYAQLPDMTTCMSVCAAYPTGTIQDRVGDTLGCRIYHGGTPAMQDPFTHCPHAGPTGGDVDPNGTMGTCGEPCDAFCEIALVVCANQPNAYASASACQTECKTFMPDGKPYSTADTTTNDMGCRFTHLSLAAESPAAATTHCALIHVPSAECTM